MKAATPTKIQHIKAQIDRIALIISSQPLGLVYHRPEDWAEAARCFENVTRKVSEAGGQTQFGWTFHLRYVEAIPDGSYLFVTHHAVWRSPMGHLVDVTPYPDPKHHPLPGPGADALFLIDDKALPVRMPTLMAPLPLQFYAVGEDAQLAEYVQHLNDREQENCRRIYAGGQA